MNRPAPGPAPDVPGRPVEPDTPVEMPPEDGKTRLKLPHENDEDTDMTADAPDPKMLQAWKDLQQGQVDTDMRATPGQDAARRARAVPGAGGQPLPQDDKSVPRR